MKNILTVTGFSDLHSALTIYACSITVHRMIMIPPPLVQLCSSTDTTEIVDTVTKIAHVNLSLKLSQRYNETNSSYSVC